MKKILFETLQKYYSEKMAYAILIGNRMPKYEVIIKLNKRIEVPFDAWLDIKAWLKLKDEQEQLKAS